MSGKSHFNLTSKNIFWMVNIIQNIRPFGHENMDHIYGNSDLKTKCLKTVSKEGIPTMFSAIWLNDDVPENNNIKFKSLCHPKSVKIFTTSGWVDSGADKPIEKCIEIVLDLLLQQAQELYQKQITENVDIETTTISLDRYDKIQQIKDKKRGSGHSQIKNEILLNLRIKESASILVE